MSQDKIIRESFFGARLRELMARDRLTQRQLADAVGISQGAVSHYLRGTRAAPGVEEAIALARHFKVTLDWLLGMDPSALVHSADPDSESRAKRDSEIEQVAKLLEECVVKLRKHLLVGETGRPGRGRRKTDS